MKAFNLLAAILLIGLAVIFAKADDGLDLSSQQALKQTQDLLTNQSQRQQTVSKDVRAKQADDFTKKLTGNAELTNEVYALAADVFAIVVKDANGDSTKMKEAMDKFTQNPASFVENWTPEQRAKLKQLSDQLPQPILKQ